MGTDKKSLSKELILETALGMIDENQGVKGVTLREIAKKLGCAHTNLYNYFSSLDEILWEAIGQVLLKMMDYCSTGGKYMAEGMPYSLLVNYVDFWMDHPGWFRLVWLEYIGGNPGTKIIEILHMPVDQISDSLMKSVGGRLTKEKADRIMGILHGYLHGELCKWINNRNFANGREETKRNILSNLDHLYKLLGHE